ncbi:MAG: hypothetical protein LBH00_03840 [Planctomycetaceae bacterium]|jgi:hypothetical protein|nr:hypothetical protein [Planctomycetaceae bacterium]
MLFLTLLLFLPLPAALADASLAADKQTATPEKFFDGTELFIVIKRFPIKSSHVYTYHYEGFKAGGGLFLAARNPDGSYHTKLLVNAAEGQILNADISFDGKTILFSWRKKKSEPYHIFTVNVDGTGLKQLTRGGHHNYDCCWLPDGGIAFLSSRSPQFAYCWNAPVGVLHRMSPDGSHLLRLSDNYLNDFTPYVLNDGRIIYSRWEYVDRPAIPIQSLWTVRPDGTNLQGYFGNRVLSPATFAEPRPIPRTDKIVCLLTGHGGIMLGAIGLLDRQHGDNAQASITNITPEVPVGNVNEGDGDHWSVRKYCNPCPLDSERFLVTAAGAVQLRTFALKNGQPESAAVLLECPPDGMWWYNAVPVKARPLPLAHAAAETATQVAEDSLRTEGGAAGIRPLLNGGQMSPALSKKESLRPAEGSPQGAEPATLALADVYQGLEGVRHGEAAAIRVVQEMPKTVRISPQYRTFGFQFPTISCGATYAGKLILGDVPVEADGSAYFKVGGTAWRSPAGQSGSGPVTGPIYFMVLDKEGRAIQRMRSFTHLMPGEQQTCIGCHEERTSAFPASARGHFLAFRKAPAELSCPDWAKPDTERAAFAPGFDYVRIVQPVWNRYCVECHNEKSRIDLTGGCTDFFNVSYDVLASENQGKKGSPFINWIPTYNGDEQNILDITPKGHGSYQSPLAELIRSGHPDKTGKRRVEMADVDRRKVYAWIDLNVPYYASSETSHPELPGNRRIYPAELDAVLNDVGRRRCAECHQDGNVQRLAWMQRTDNRGQFAEERGKGTVPRRSWVRITEPEKNPFLLAPLAKSAGGTEQCGTIIFRDKNDVDYVRILRTFDGVQELLRVQPRIDMPGGKPAENVCRDTY